MLALAALILLAAQRLHAVELEAILQKTAVEPPSRVAFVEERHNRLFSEPLVLTGYLEYLGEGRLRKVVESPFVETFLVDDTSIRVSRDGETRRISLRNSRSMEFMFSGIKALLAGNPEQLERFFDPAISGTADDWSLTLEPRSRQVARKLDSIAVTGNADSIASIRFDLGDGEWHLMRIGRHGNQSGNDD